MKIPGLFQLIINSAIGAFSFAACLFALSFGAYLGAALMLASVLFWILGARIALLHLNAHLAAAAAKPPITGSGFRVEPDLSEKTCASCGHVAFWQIVGPDGMASGTVYEDHDEAADVAYDLGRAFQMGQEASEKEPSL